MCESCGCGHNASVPQRLAVGQDLLARNDRVAAHNREHLTGQGILALNLMSSPGAGKTSLLVETIRRLSSEVEVAVVEGDQQTSRDADRIAAAGARALQINTGTGCHLDAYNIHNALHELHPRAGSVVFIENVGNLVCPALFDLGEAHKVVVLSVPEGDDKPAKYPHMFAAADLMLVNKIDLLDYVDFDPACCLDEARRVNPDIEVLHLSARTGQGMDDWIRWVQDHRPRVVERPWGVRAAEGSLATSNS